MLLLSQNLTEEPAKLQWASS
ncbi:hypothetical protein BDFB_014265 [Asbolus verrucosus]|uniref:Uncharacterized protein n=1 Tax=Asbolus verrucosus TaxID=1661398 RepID=A0A482VW71_ASBVE|nr:hypothetical protein BDFB_014265 [Asbolus verrucosus]